jgi:hypothetical protein
MIMRRRVGPLREPSATASNYDAVGIHRLPYALVGLEHNLAGRHYPFGYFIDELPEGGM